MTMGPRTDREKLIAELANLQGMQEGIEIITKLLRERALKALAALTESTSSES